MKKHYLVRILDRITPIAALCTFLPALSHAQSPPSYVVSTVAGNNTIGSAGDGGQATSAQLNIPFSTFFSGGKLYIADQDNNRIRVVTAGVISTVAGNGASGFKGDGGSATGAELSSPLGMAVDSAGNLYIADTINNVVRKVTSSGTINTVAGYSAAGPGFGGDNGPATAAVLNHPSAVAVDAAGNIYIADTGNNAVREVLAASNATQAAGNIITIAGNQGFGPGFYGDGGPATSAKLNNPEGLFVDAKGNIYIADTLNNAIRVVLASNGGITTLAGTGNPTGGFSGDGGLATSARLNNPEGVAVDAAGDIFVADSFNNRIRVVTPNGIIATVAGKGQGGYGGDGGIGTSALFKFPSGITVDPTGKVYVSDNQNDVIRLLTPLPRVPSISSGGVASAAAFGVSSSAAPGSWIEIYGLNLAADARAWTGADFTGANAPTSLDGTTVTVGGQAAFIDYISAGQVNAQVPSNVGTGTQQIAVTTALGASASYPITINTTQPGFYAPPLLKVAGRQYAGALFSDGATYVLPPGAVPGISSRQAKPGETITFYGVGFGAVTPNIPAGQIVQQNNALALPLQIFFGQTPAAAPFPYAGLAPGAIGLYQFNVVVPNVPDNDIVPLTFNLGGVTGTQVLFTAVKQ